MNGEPRDPATTSDEPLPASEPDRLQPVSEMSGAEKDRWAREANKLYPKVNRRY